MGKSGSMNANEVAQDDEISLFDLWGKLRDGWRYVVGGAALGLVGAAVAIVAQPPKYEAVAIVQVGQVGQYTFAPLGQVMAAPSLPVEPATQAVERMKTPSFQSTVASRIGNHPWIDDLQRSSGATAKYLSSQVVKATVGPGTVPLIELKATADSPENAKKIADGAVFELSRRHTEIARPMIEKMQLDLTIAKERLASAEKELEAVNKLVANAGVKDDRFTQLALMTSLRVEKEAELFSQRQLIFGIEAVFVGDKPVSPKKTLLLALGLIGGLLAGVVSAFFVDASQRSKQKRA
jgi:uncharacterized protein involved in exopolysaccharide biosynthesis